MEDYYPITFDGVYNEEYKITTKAKDKFGVDVTNVEANSDDIQGSRQAFIFVIKYMNTYDDKDEVRPPEQPLLPDINICELFGNEVDIFSDILSDIDDISTRDAILVKIKHIVEIIRITEIFKLELLLDKLSAIIAYCIQIPSILD
jgi:hypothetical protein